MRLWSCQAGTQGFDWFVVDLMDPFQLPFLMEPWSKPLSSPRSNSRWKPRSFITPWHLLNLLKPCLKLCLGSVHVAYSTPMHHCCSGALHMMLMCSKHNSHHFNFLGLSLTYFAISLPTFASKFCQGSVQIWKMKTIKNMSIFHWNR